jgi:hypothetical protein
MTVWIKDLLYTNVGGLVGGGALQIFSSIIDQIVLVLRFMLSFIFKSGDDRDREY